MNVNFIGLCYSLSWQTIFKKNACGFIRFAYGICLYFDGNFGKDLIYSSVELHIDDPTFVSYNNSWSLSFLLNTHEDFTHIGLRDRLPLSPVF